VNNTGVKRNTPRQKLVTHLMAEHDATGRHKGTHQELALGHQTDHDSKFLAHKHLAGGIVTGGDVVRFKIFLSPPRNPAAAHNGDRNWTLQLVTETGGYRYPLTGTR
jgi:hypothetical protein